MIGHCTNAIIDAVIASPDHCCCGPLLVSNIHVSDAKDQLLRLRAAQWMIGFTRKNDDLGRDATGKDYQCL